MVNKARPAQAFVVGAHRSITVGPRLGKNKDEQSIQTRARLEKAIGQIEKKIEKFDQLLNKDEEVKKVWNKDNSLQLCPSIQIDSLAENESTA